MKDVKAAYEAVKKIKDKSSQEYKDAILKWRDAVTAQIKNRQK